ncbi:MAG: hypothetical protein AABX10_04370 [Nanoarchaeota archaeon]
MIGLFLQALAVDSTDAPPLVFIMAIVAALGIFVFLVLLFAVYLYLSFAYSAIGKRAKVKSSGLAWIPFIGPVIVAYKASKMKAWPWFLIIGLLIPVVNVIAHIAFTIFVVIWHWKMFESVKRPGWWSILMLIPIVNLVMVGVAAWGKK